MIKELPYQTRVLLAALEITKDNNNEAGYEFHMAGEDLILTPWTYIEQRKEDRHY